MAEPPKNPPAPKLPISLYPELLQAERATISAAPVRYDPQQQKADEEAKKKKKDASLQFQPIKRPQPQQKKKPQPKPGFPSSSSVNTASASSPPKSVVGSTPSIQRSTFDDWVAAAEDDDEFYYQDRPRAQRGGKNRKKKNKGQEVRTWDWDDIYDPSRPNVYADYKGSEEQHREVKEWKARLYHRQLEEIKKVNKGRSEEETDGTRPTHRMFAPPTFDEPPPPQPVDEDDEYYPLAHNGHRDSYSSNPAAPSASVPDDPTGEDAYLRRMRMSGMAANQSPPVSSPPKAPSVSTPPPTDSSIPPPSIPVAKSQEERKAEALAKIAAIKARFAKPAPDQSTQQTPSSNTAATSPAPSQPVPKRQPSVSPPPPPPAPPQEPGVVVSRQPVIYKFPEGHDILEMMEEITNPDVSKTLIDSRSDTQQPQAHRPSKKGFAERLLKKYGWEKGQGLGAQGEGITTALIGKADKRKKRSDADGGGWAAPANMGKIVGGKRRKIDDDSNTTEHNSNLSSVIKLQGMLRGLDVQKEIEDNNLMQEIGDEMGTNYGNVERVFIWREEQGGANEVFVKFTSQLSALRAKDAMDGTTFADNEVQAAFWDEEKFEQGEYAA